jgi:uncharacterized membrane protein
MKSNNKTKIKQMKNKTFLIILGVLSLLLIIIPFILYVCTFGGSLSHNREVWGQFGDFFNMFVSMASLIVVSTLTYIIYIYQREDESNKLKYQREDESNKSIPILIFKVNAVKKVWVVQNVGKGVALNILVSYSKTQGNWEIPTKIYSLTENSEIELSWFEPSEQCSAMYYDYLENSFSSICQKDDTQFIKGGKHLIEFKSKSNYHRLEDKAGLRPMVY